MHPVRASSPATDHMRSELSTRRLHRYVGLPGGDGKAFGDELEVVNQRLHRLRHDVFDVFRRVALTIGPDGQLCRPGDLFIFDHDRPRGQPIQALLDDLQ